jgi:hypothetical protein
LLEINQARRYFIMAPAKSSDPKDLLKGAILQCVEAGTVGLPFEVWKTHMGANRQQGTMESFRSVYRNGGLKAFYAGFSPKMFESFFKGGILLFAKESIISATSPTIGDGPAALIGGFGGGVAQVAVIGPCSLLVTAAVHADKSAGANAPSVMQQVSSTYKSHGIKGFYRGGLPLTLRQGSNWASRQFLTELVRKALKDRKEDPSQSLSNMEEAFSGIVGGALSTWNQPFEVLRIEAQSHAAKGLPARTFTETYQHILAESGWKGFFRGIIPRVGLCVTQTLFMVTIPHVMKKSGW